jgi:hypothetical protein
MGILALKPFIVAGFGCRQAGSLVARLALEYADAAPRLALRFAEKFPARPVC